MQREDSQQPVNPGQGQVNPQGGPPPPIPPQYVPPGQYQPPQYVPQPPQYAPQGQYPPSAPYPQPYPPYAPYGQQAPAEQAEPASSGDRLPMLIVLGGFLLVAIISLVRGELLTFLSIGLEIAPFAVLALLAYAGRKNVSAAVFAYIWLALLIVALFVNVLVNTLMPFLNQAELNEMAGTGSGIFAPGAINKVIEPGASAAVGSALLLSLVVLAISLAMLARPVRVQIARVMPIDPDNLVHKIALCIVTLMTLSSFVPMLVLGGEPPLLKAASSEQAASLVGPLSLIYQLVWTIPAALVAAGWPVARSFNATLARLGVVRPSGKQVLAGIGLGLGLALAAALVIDPVIHLIWTSMGWPTTDQAAFEKLLSNLITPVGAVVIGVTAGIGEELMVRGLLQPRFGIVAAALFFTSLHAFQYSLDGLFSVFIIGRILGVIRARSNTTTSAIVHGMYDFVLVMATVLLAPLAK